jgi:hypothetical protein
MDRRAILLACAASVVATAAEARRSGDRTRGTRGTRTPREPRTPSEPRYPVAPNTPPGRATVTVIGVWTIGIILILEDTGEECVVIGHNGVGDSICEVVP